MMRVERGRGGTSPRVHPVSRGQRPGRFSAGRPGRWRPSVSDRAHCRIPLGELGSAARLTRCGRLPPCAPPVATPRSSTRAGASTTRPTSSTRCSMRSSARPPTASPCSVPRSSPADPRPPSRGPGYAAVEARRGSSCTGPSAWQKLAGRRPRRSASPGHRTAAPRLRGHPPAAPHHRRPRRTPWRPRRRHHRRPRRRARPLPRRAARPRPRRRHAPVPPGARPARPRGAAARHEQLRPQAASCPTRATTTSSCPWSPRWRPPARSSTSRARSTTAPSATAAPAPPGHPGRGSGPAAPPSSPP